jgi:hypothetical protein
MARSDYRPAGSNEVDADQEFKKLIGSNFSRAFPLPTEANDNDVKFKLLLDAIRKCCSPDH